MKYYAQNHLILLSPKLNLSLNLGLGLGLKFSLYLKTSL